MSATTDAGAQHHAGQWCRLHDCFQDDPAHAYSSGCEQHLVEPRNLIDPDDPAVRERLRKWLVYDMKWIPPHDKPVLESLLAALKEANDA